MKKMPTPHHAVRTTTGHLQPVIMRLLKTTALLVVRITLHRPLENTLASQPGPLSQIPALSTSANHCVAQTATASAVVAAAAGAHTALDDQDINAAVVAAAAGIHTALDDQDVSAAVVAAAAGAHTALDDQDVIAAVVAAVAAALGHHTAAASARWQALNGGSVPLCGQKLWGSGGYCSMAGPV